jgi:hypothetical protein
MKFVIINKDMVTNKIRANQQERLLPNGQVILRVNDNNEDYLTDYIKYSEDEIRSLDLTSTELHKSKSVYIPDTVKLQQIDPDTGAVSISPRWAPEGWYQQLYEIEFETCKIDSVHEKDWMNNDIGWCHLKFFDADNVELLEQNDIDANCVRTDVEWMPNIDYMIKGGFIGQITQPAENIYVWTQGVILPDWAGGPQATFGEGGINMIYVGAHERVGLDGVAGTILYYEHPQLGRRYGNK